MLSPPDDPSTAYVLRPPLPADAERLGWVQCTVWQATYRESLSPAVYAALSPAAFAESWSQRLADVGLAGQRRGGGRVVVAEHPAQGIVGFVSAGPPLDDHPPAPEHLWAIYVLPEHHGTGLAHRLLAAALADRPAYLWVDEQNARAQAFYRRVGFTLDGETRSEEYEGMVLVRMVRGVASGR